MRWILSGLSLIVVLSTLLDQWTIVVLLLAGLVVSLFLTILAFINGPMVSAARYAAGSVVLLLC